MKTRKLEELNSTLEIVSVNEQKMYVGGGLQRYLDNGDRGEDGSGFGGGLSLGIINNDLFSSDPTNYSAYGYSSSDSDSGFTTYSQSTAIAMMDNGSWTGGIVDGWGYVAPETTYTLNSGVSNNNTSYLDNAKKYAGVPYVWGGSTPDGMDCSGLVEAATGNIGSHSWSTNGGLPPGSWTIISANRSSIDTFMSSLQPGDLLVWTGCHTAFYDGGSTLFHAHGGNGGEVGYTNDLKNYWLPQKGYPTIYRER